MEYHVKGRFKINQGQLDKLKSQWHNEECKVIVATDGGLKDAVGMSSYELLFPNESPAIVQGYTGEYQPSRTASSTQQELLGQLGVGYWLARFATLWGIPREIFQLTLLTDSQASIDIIENTKNLIDIKDTLRAGMDVGIELLNQQQQNN